jgi:hypothetical protein
MRSRKKCTLDGCNLPISFRVLCKKHSHKFFNRKQTRCRVELCDKPVINITNKLCSTHYEVFLKNNNFEKKETRPRNLNLEDVWEWCVGNSVTLDELYHPPKKKTPFLVWFGPIRDGYGKSRWNNDKVNVYVHIYAYEKSIGPVGNSYVYNQFGNRLCINVEHLQLVTNEENSKRANLLEGKRQRIGWVHPNQKSIDRFWETVDKSMDGCLLWFGTTDGKVFMNYGRFWYQNHRQRPHRFSNWLKYKSLSDGYAIHHKCDIQVCVRPDHLKEITLKDNAGISQSKYLTIDEIFFSQKKREYDLRLTPLLE